MIEIDEEDGGEEGFKNRVLSFLGYLKGICEGQLSDDKLTLLVITLRLISGENYKSQFFEIFTMQ
jgi:hypothetical protein